MCVCVAKPLFTFFISNDEKDKKLRKIFLVAANAFISHFNAQTSKEYTTALPCIP
jgi:hypothetical protein